MPRRRRALSVTGLAVIAPVVALALAMPARAQTPVFADLLQPSLLDNPNPDNPPRFRRPGSPVRPLPDQAPPPGRFTAPSRIGATPVYGSPTGFGAGDTGFDSSNRPHRRRVAKTPPGGSEITPAPQTTFENVPSLTPQVPSTVPVLPPPPPPQVYPARAASRPGAVLPPPPDQLPISNPPAEVHPLTAANRPGAVLAIPPPELFSGSASTPPPGTPLPNTLALGVVPQGALPFVGGDPYEALGIRAGSFLILPAVETSVADSTNPQHVPGGPGSVYYVVAPELHVRSDWPVHSLTADVIGSYTGYLNSSFVPALDAPYINAKVDGRIDVTRDTNIPLESRVIVSTDNPGSPNIQAGLARLPIMTTVGGTAGVDHQFSRLDVSLKGTFDRSTEQNANLTDGENVSDDFRNFDQYAGILRVGYEIEPGFKPFVETSEDKRTHDQLDQFGEDRNSDGSSVKVGSAFSVTNWLTGEMAVGYMERRYVAPLPNVNGITVDGSLLWQATGLTTAKFTAVSVATESVLQGVSAALSRDFNVEVDHALRRWLIATLQVGYGRDEYFGLGREDNRYFAAGGLIYKLNREMQIKGTVREDWLTSNVSGVAYQATSFLLGLRLQR